jgi:putative ABC transport system permease protein
MTDIRRLARTMDPAVPIAELLAMDEVIERSIGSRALRAVPAVAFGLLALAVASAGLLATLSTLVVERRRNLAIRSAVGAKRRKSSG